MLLAKKNLDKTAGFVPFPGEAVGWYPWLSGFSNQAYQMFGTGYLCSSKWSEISRK